MTEPWAAHLHWFARGIRKPQAALVQLVRGDLERSRHWLLLETRGRKSGLPREVLLPCARSPEGVLVVSTYGERAHWLRNIEADPHVVYNDRGRRVEGIAEVIDDLAHKHALAERFPFVPLAPVPLVQSLARGALRGPVTVWLRSWVAPRPVVLIRPAQDGRET